MTSYKLYGIPNCNTVKKAQDFLTSKKVSFEFINFKKQAPNLADIERWTLEFGALPINKSGLTYKKFKAEFEGLTPAQKQKFLISNSSMIKRPILEKNNKVLCFGFNEDEYSEVL